jgi:four helix bundle protein
MTEFASTYKDLRVYVNARKAAMEIFFLTKKFPHTEKYSMVDQMRRSSRSVCTNIAEGWRKRRYRAAFIAKLNDAETEACETQVWLDFALSCNYLLEDIGEKLDSDCNLIIGQFVHMIDNADTWLIKSTRSD